MRLAMLALRAGAAGGEDLSLSSLELGTAKAFSMVVAQAIVACPHKAHPAAICPTRVAPSTAAVAHHVAAHNASVNGWGVAPLPPPLASPVRTAPPSRVMGAAVASAAGAAASVH